MSGSEKGMVAGVHSHILARLGALFFSTPPLAPTHTLPLLGLVWLRQITALKRPFVVAVML